MIDQWKLAKWLHDFEADVDKDGIQLVEWDSLPQRVRDAYYAIAGECINDVEQQEWK